MVKQISQISMTNIVIFILCAIPVATHAQTAADDLFSDASNCQACHNGIADKNGDASIGIHWRASVMANSSNDPYWRASVRRETVDHPTAASAIEDKCATCHMPMARFSQMQSGEAGQVFAHLPDGAGRFSSRLGTFARDGVSCSVCHQIQDKALGDKSSFSGGFHIDVSKAAGERDIYGPYEIASGVSHVMASATGFVPKSSDHIRQSELCATCHTLYTHALDRNGNEVAVLAEQVPYLEWRHSDYVDASSCQECHMSPAEGPMSISSVLGTEREDVQKHIFKGGNVFLLSMLSAFSNDLFVSASPAELQQAKEATFAQLQQNAADLDVSIAPVTADDRQIMVFVTLSNLAGHKLPTAYPSRRVWLQVTAKNADRKIIFESGRLYDGKIRGNDNDRDPGEYEPHYDIIDSPEQVQIYEAILGDGNRRVTTGLLTATDYIKDNRILPSGFDKFTAPNDVAVKGLARDDISFGEGSDKIVYQIPVAAAKGTYTVSVKLWYQPIGYRWAVNLNDVKGAEPAQFSRMYRQMDKDLTAVRLAEKTLKTTVLPNLTITEADRAAAAGNEATSE